MNESMKVPICEKCGAPKKQRPSGGWRCNKYACRHSKEAANDNQEDPRAVAVKRAAEQRQESQVRREHAALLADNERLRLELEASLGLKGYKPAVPSTKFDAAGESIACVVASDWHMGETVDPATVSELNEYHPAIACWRADAFFQNSLKLVDMMASDTEIDTIHGAFAGDFGTNWLHEENRETNKLAPVDETRLVLERLSGGVDFWLKESPYNIFLNCMNGNHERLTKQTRSANRVGTSLGSMVYWALQARYAGNPRVRVDVPRTNVAYVPLFGGDYLLRELHGDEVSYGGGVGGISIPLNKAIAGWDVAIKADMTVLGHFHQLQFGPRFVCNGSLIGYNSYAQSIRASPEPAQQAFFLVHRRFGRTICAPIFLDASRGPLASDVMEAA
jgi:hypothetical protein